MPSHEAALVAAARRVATCQRQRASLRRRLKEVAGELRLAKKQLRALVQSTRDPLEQTPPLRLFGEK